MTTEIKRETVSFQRFDKKGREIGAEVLTQERTENGVTTYWWAGFALRDGKDFGSAGKWSVCPTADDREDAISRYLKGAERRAEKNSV
jgi:hypothetical protein